MQKVGCKKIKYRSKKQKTIQLDKFSKNLLSVGSKSEVTLTIVQQCNGKKLNGLCFLEMISERIGSASRTNALAQMGLLSEEKVEKLGSPLDTISNHLASTLSYGPAERDMILMRHDVSKIVPKIVPKISQKLSQKMSQKLCQILSQKLTLSATIWLLLCPMVLPRGL